MSVRSYIVDDHENKTFMLDREVLVSEEVLRREMAQIFGRCWIYVGHSSELKKAGDFRSRRVAGRPVIFCRDQQGKFHCLFNTCRHRGAIVCTEREGNRAPVPMHLSWLDLRQRRPAGGRAGRRRLRRELRQGGPRSAPAGPFRGLSRLLVHVPRPRGRSARRLSRRPPRTTSTSSSTSRRPGRWRSSPACRNTTSPPIGS